VKNSDVMLARRFDDRVRELCAKALSAKEPEEFTVTLCELQSVIRQRIVRHRKLALAASNGQPAFPQERRIAG
jgi:hypothetical protein